MADRWTGEKRKREAWKRGYLANEKPLFATSESVGAYWEAVGMAKRRYKSIKGSGAIAKPSTMAGKVVVIPPVRGE